MKKVNLVEWVLLFILIAVLSFALSSCYNQRKATSQFSRAVTAYPKIGADYAATAFPVRDSIIKGDSILTTDTVTYFQQSEDTITVQDLDTVRVYITKTLPAKIITNTVHVTDTVRWEGGQTAAKLASCQIDNSRLTQLLVTVTEDRDKFKAKSRMYFWMFWGLVLLVIGSIAMRIYMKSKSVLK